MTLAVNLANLANYVNADGKLSLSNGVVNTLPVANGGTGQNAYTDGQLLIGNSATGGLTPNTLQAGAGIQITNQNGAIVIAAGSVGFPSGTAMLFVQSAAPQGWTKSTTFNDVALRVVNGNVGSGGSVPFSTAFSQSNTGTTALSVEQMPSHTHGVNDPGHSHTLTQYFGGQGNQGYGFIFGTTYQNSGTYCPTNKVGTGISISANGSGAGHSHTVALNVQYVDTIIATKD